MILEVYWSPDGDYLVQLYKSHTLPRTSVRVRGVPQTALRTKNQNWMGQECSLLPKDKQRWEQELLDRFIQVARTNPGCVGILGEKPDLGKQAQQEPEAREARSHQVGWLEVAWSKLAESRVPAPSPCAKRELWQRAQGPVQICSKPRTILGIAVFKIVYLEFQPFILKLH